MILTPSEYAQTFKVNKKKVSARTVRDRCMKGLLPSNHIPRRLNKGVWIIEILDNAK